MAVEENAAIGRRLVDILNERDWDSHFELIAEDCKWEDVPAGSITRGPRELVEETKSFVAAFPDIHVETLRVIAQGDLVEIEWGSRRSAAARWCRTETTSTACRCTSRSDGDRAHLAQRWRQPEGSAGGRATTERRPRLATPDPLPLVGVRS